jgi:hypothetical protein
MIDNETLSEMWSRAIVRAAESGEPDAIVYGREAYERGYEAGVRAVYEAAGWHGGTVHQLKEWRAGLARDLAATRERIAELERNVETATMIADKVIAERDAAERDLAAARAECERMRPVVEAAVAFDSAISTDVLPIQDTAVDALSAAVAAYTARKEPGT